jgi:hypothetical protein
MAGENRIRPDDVGATAPVGGLSREQHSLVANQVDATFRLMDAA